MQITVPVLIDPKRNGVAIVVRWQGKILCCERIGCRDANGTWQLPGGAIEDREIPQVAAARELYEEAGLNMFDHCFKQIAIGIGAMPCGTPHVTTFFLLDLKLKLTPVNKEPGKHGDWEWLAKEELLARPIIELIRPVLESI